MMEMKLEISDQLSREEKYKQLLPQVNALLGGEDDLIANMANLSAILHEAFGFLWTGFYIWKDNSLVLGPFQGPIACTRINSGSGVCGTSYEKKQTIVVPNVDEFPGHIACSSLSKSEIVVPLIENDNCLGVLDIDSSQLANFDEIDAKYLEEMVHFLITNSKL